MEHQKAINDTIREIPKSVPSFVYELDGYKHERLLTFAPVSEGDLVTIKLSDGTFLKDKHVVKVVHYSEVSNMGNQVLTSAIRLED